MTLVSIAYDSDRFERLVRQVARRLRADFTRGQVVAELGRYYPEQDIWHVVSAIGEVPRVTQRRLARFTLEFCLWSFLVIKAATFAGTCIDDSVPQGLGVVFLALSPIADLVALTLFYRLNRASYIGIGLTMVVFLPAFTGFNEALAGQAWLDGVRAAGLYALAFGACGTLIRKDATALYVRDVLREDRLA